MLGLADDLKKLKNISKPECGEKLALEKCGAKKKERRFFGSLDCVSNIACNGTSIQD